MEIHKGHQEMAEEQKEAVQVSINAEETEEAPLMKALSMVKAKSVAPPSPEEE